MSKDNKKPLEAGDPAILLEALKRIKTIEHKMYGPDWEEIVEAQEIASEAVLKFKGEVAQDEEDSVL